MTEPRTRSGQALLAALRAGKDNDRIQRSMVLMAVEPDILAIENEAALLGPGPAEPDSLTAFVYWLSAQPPHVQRWVTSPLTVENEVRATNEVRAALLDELEAAVRGMEQHERELASRTDVAPLVTNDAESRIRAYARIHEFIQQHRETT